MANHPLIRRVFPNNPADAAEVARARRANALLEELGLIEPEANPRVGDAVVQDAWRAIHWDERAGWAHGLLWAVLFVMSHIYSAVVLWLGAKGVIWAFVWWPVELAGMAFLLSLWGMVMLAEFAFMVVLGAIRCVFFIVVIIRWLDDPLFGVTPTQPFCDVPTAAFLLGVKEYGQCVV